MRRRALGRDWGENLLSHECQSFLGKCLVYLFAALVKINITQVSQSVFASRLRPFPLKPILTKMLTFQPPTP